MDDNLQYAKTNILNSLEEACEQTDDLYVDELRWRINSIIEDAKTKVTKSIDSYCRKYRPQEMTCGCLEYN